jgi:hypothetical protein
MFFFSKLKQKLAKQTFTNSQKSVLAIFSVACFFIFFYPHVATAADIFPTGEELIVVPILKLALKFTGFLLSLAETIFQWIVNPANMKAVIDNKIIYQIWRTVRDVFNVAFIMVLLFSAFATIFQSAANFNYKKVLLNLVIMALLVNFSYPIARFIIDASNMMMYGFLGKIGGSNSFLTIINESGLDQIFTPTTKDPDTLFLLSAVIFTFIFAITLLIIAVLLVIRTITLAVYVIFSPIAFVGSILPGTALAEAGSKWWKDFMQQCFAGPIMVFMLYVATQMIIAINASKGNMTEIAGLQTVAGQGGFGDTLGKFIASASFFAIPIIILWLGIIKAQESGIHGAKAVVGAGTKLMKNVGMKVSGGQFIKDTHKAYSSRRAKAKEDSWANKLGGNLGSQQDRLRGKFIGGTDARLRYNADQLAKVKKETERNDMTNLAPDQLNQISQSGNKHAQAAALQELANRNILDMNNPASAAAYQRMRDEFGTTSQVFNQINNKLKAFDPVSAFAHIDPTNANSQERNDRMTEYINSNQFDAKKLNANSLGNENFMNLAFREGAINNDDLEELRKKSPTHERNIIASLGNLAGRADLGDIEDLDTRRQTALTNSNNTNMTQPEREAFAVEATQLDNQLRVARSVHTAHFAQTGNFHNTITTAAAAAAAANRAPVALNHLVSRLNEKTAKRITTDMIDNHGEVFVRQLNGSKYKAIIQGIDHGEAQRRLNALAREAQFVGIRNHNTAINDPDINNIH